MTRLNKESDYNMSYRAKPNGAPSICGVSVFRANIAESPAAVIILTELPYNKGMSVTNAFEQIASEIMNRMRGRMLPEHTLWVQYCPRESCGGGIETYEVVALTWDDILKTYKDPKWHRIAGPIKLQRPDEWASALYEQEQERSSGKEAS